MKIILPHKINRFYNIGGKGLQMKQPFFISFFGAETSFKKDIFSL